MLFYKSKGKFLTVFAKPDINTQGAGRILKKISKVMQASDFTLGNCITVLNPPNNLSLL